MQRALQPFRRAHNAHIVPHQQSKLIPVMRNHNLLVGVLNLTLIPWRQDDILHGTGRHNRLGCAPANHHALQKGVAGQPIGPMQAGIPGLAHCKEAL